jgi:flagella basal body P-ring formation protein FlgA
MRAGTRKEAFTALLALGLAGAAAAGTQTLEDLLRVREPAVTRWQVQPLTREPLAADFADAQLGRIAARTPVRFADGRVRWYAVSAYREVLVTTRALEAGDAVNESDAHLESRDVLALGCAPLAQLDESQRLRARRHLGAGEALCSTSIEAAPEVERNCAVTLSAQRGGIQVSRVLIASNDARRGERVRLRDHSSGDVLIGIVTGPATARIAGETR